MDLEINDFNYRIEKDIGEFFEELDLSNKAKNLFYRLPDYKIHSLKVTKIAEKVAKELEYSPEKVKSIKKSALMHDIGKLKVNPDIFLNDKKLTQKQRKIYIEPHIKKTKEILEELDEFTEKEIKIATQHHETINGKGYPEGLGGDEISQEGKILKACDTFEAITDDRLHNPAKTLDKTKEIMEDLSGKKIDRKIANITYEKGVEVYKDYLKKVIPHTTLKKFKNH